MTGELFNPEAFEQMRGQMSMSEDAELRPSPAPGFWEMWIGGRFCGTYNCYADAVRATTSRYADACRKMFR